MGRDRKALKLCPAPAPAVEHLKRGVSCADLAPTQRQTHLRSHSLPAYISCDPWHCITSGCPINQSVSALSDRCGSITQVHMKLSLPGGRAVTQLRTDRYGFVQDWFAVMASAHRHMPLHHSEISVCVCVCVCTAYSSPTGQNQNVQQETIRGTVDFPFFCNVKKVKSLSVVALFFSGKMDGSFNLRSFISLRSFNYKHKLHGAAQASFTLSVSLPFRSFIVSSLKPRVRLQNTKFSLSCVEATRVGPNLLWVRASLLQFDSLSLLSWSLACMNSEEQLN